MVYTFTMAEHQFEVILDGGGPWGFRLQGGKDFGIPLNVSRVTPGSKAAFKQIVAGDIICKINGVDTEGLSHMEAQNHIKNAGSRLRMIVRKGKGISIGDQNAIALGAAGSPKVMTQSEVIHSAGVDHQFNPKPKPFGFSPSSSPSTQSTSPVKVTAPVSSSVHAPKFDPGAYARKKKEELEQRKKAESNVAGDSDILKIINATSISKVPTVPASSEGEEAPAADPGAFRMVYSGRDIHEEVSPGSKSVISSLKDRVSQENSGLNSESKVPSRVFQMLQKQLDEEQPEASPQDLIDALKQRIRNESPPCATNYDEGLRSHKIGNQNEAMRPLKPTQLPRLIPPQNLSNYQRKDEDQAPIDADHVFKMSYNSRDFRNSDISAGSVNVMNSLKEKLAEKSARGSLPGNSRTTPSRVHAMLNDQLGNVEDETEMRFHSDQTRTVPSKVFQALQHCYPGVEYSQPLSPREYHALRPSEKEIDDHDVYERFIGNPTDKVPSKVFQALQYSYGAGGESASDLVSNQNRILNERQANHIPSKSFQMLNRQYSKERDHQATAALSDDLQHALDLLERELDSMTIAKTNTTGNPIITVPLHKGVPRNDRISEDMTSLSSTDNHKIEVPLNRRGFSNPGYQSTQHVSQEPITAPPVPVRVDSKKFQYSAIDRNAIESEYEAPVAKHQGAAMVPQSRRWVGNDEDEVMIAPVAHTEKVVAYSAEFETPWINPKSEKPKGNRSLIINPKSSSRNHRDCRMDSFDSTSSHSSIQQRIPDFDPETYVITTKPPSVSSRGLRSDSSDSGHSLSSHSSNTEPRFEEENGTSINAPGGRYSEAFQQKPRKMVINVNGKTRMSESEKIADAQFGTNEGKNERMPTALKNLQEMNSRNEVDRRENEAASNDDMKICQKSYEMKNEDNECQNTWDSTSKSNEMKTSKLKDITLEPMNSEEINEVFVQNDEQTMTFDEIKNPIQSRIQVKSGLPDEELTPCDPFHVDGEPRRISAVHIQSRKQQQQHQLICNGPVVRRSNQSRFEKPKSPPVNVQMSKNSNRRSIQLDQSMKYDDHLVNKSSQSSVNNCCLNNSHTSSTTSQRRLPIRDESFIVASEVKDSNEMSEERLKEAFEVINATADRILDQIDKVGSFHNGEDDCGDYCSYEQRSDRQTSTDSPNENGAQMDQDDNEYRSRQYEKESPSFSGEKNRQKIVKRTEVAPIRISNNKQPMESSNIQISSLSPGVRITLPAFTVKVSTSQNSLRDLPPPPPELIDDEEPARVSFGSSGPGAQSKTFKMLQDSIGNDQTHQSVFSRPQEDRNKAVPIPMKTSPAPPQQTTVNAIPKPPMPSGPNFKATSPKAPSFNAYSTPNTYKPPASSGTSPLFKPSSSPQPASSPQVTTAKVPSQKTALPIDPSRTPHCHNCNEEIRGPFVSAIGKTWHPEHFACNSCKASLQNQGFVEEQDKLFCEQCYNNFFAPKCASCDKPIIGNCVNAVGKAYHPEHFLCESCGKNFNNEGFLIEMGKPYCERCHDDLFGVKCAGCKRSITGGQRYVEALNQNWHTDCFICGACKARLEGASFYVVNGKPFCGLHKSGM